jgi:polyisoprenoid-binding protein YceI
MRKLASVLIPLGLCILTGCSGPSTNKGKGGGPGKASYPEGGTPSGSAGTMTKPLPIKDGKVAFDASNSRIDFVGSKPEGKHDGGFKKFTGTAEVTPDGKGLSKVSVDIDAESIWTDTEKLTGHLKTPDFFDVKQFPKASFTSTKIEPGATGAATHSITGNLTLHGVTKEISIPAIIVFLPDSSMTLQSNFTLNRLDFGMLYGKGKIHDDVSVKVSVGVVGG